MPRSRQPSRRNARGAGWHKRGYRDMGCMWLNIKQGSYGSVRGMDVNEHSTLAELIEQVYSSESMCDGYPLPDGWAFEVQRRGRPLPYCDELITELLDGGETLTVKIFDEEGQQMVFNGNEWAYHVPGRPERRQSIGDYFFYNYGF
ncbi:hypothetical protein DL93DRAFT_2233751 [Clavulina sp. PMI_390]|nr:hypothetical protein DL93DRAFT_2233751 [Clavulina sp. PMI_390]